MNNCTARSRVLSLKLCRGRVRAREDNGQGGLFVRVSEVYFEFLGGKVKFKEK